MQPVSIVGCGYTGLRLARRWLARDSRVRGFAVRAESLQSIAAAGALAVTLDLDGASAGAADFAHELVYYLVPPARVGVHDARLERFLQELQGRPTRLIYMSTTGVYGDQQGARVDEDTPPAPLTERAVRRLAAENLVRAWGERRDVSWCILRVPGIYGPGRLPLERLRRGVPAIEPREAAPGNRIQVEDLVSACVAAGSESLAGGRIYNVTDGSEDSHTAYLQRVARLALLPEPPLIGREQARLRMTDSWSFLGESRRVDNRRMREELGVTPAYADLDEGIRASL